MANIKSAKKDIIKSAKNRERNVAIKSKMRTFVTKARKAIAGSGEAADVVKEVVAASRVIDITAQKGVIKKATAGRYKSRLALALNKRK